jgi:putative PIN family toxin of toxin-antitoxin system
MSHRVVLDTNCIVSALLFSRQQTAWLRYSWQSDRIVPLVSQQTTKELLRVLSYPKFQLSKEEQVLLLADFLPYAETIPALETPVDLPLIRDPADQVFLTLAVAGKAEALVSGDKDLLAIKNSFLTVPIMNLSEFADWLKEKK